MERSTALVWLAAIGAGCSGIPEVIQVDALDGDAIVATLADDIPSDASFAVDLPVSVGFDLTFDETMSIPSAKEHVWVEDENGGKLDVEIDGRLSVLSVTPAELLAPEENHTLVIEASLEDNSGNSMLGGYRIAFYTAPAE